MGPPVLKGFAVASRENVCPGTKGDEKSNKKRNRKTLLYLSLALEL